MPSRNGFRLSIRSSARLRSTIASGLLWVCPVRLLVHEARSDGIVGLKRPLIDKSKIYGTEISWGTDQEIGEVLGISPDG
jgi:hypothetical protein